MRHALDLNALAVDTFATTPQAAPAGMPLTYEPTQCEEALFMMGPISAHTNPCDPCCQK